VEIIFNPLLLIRGLVNFQWMFFIWLIDSKIKIEKKYEAVFYYLGVSSIISIVLYDLSFEYYNTHLLFKYCVMVMFAVWTLSTVYDFKVALSLGFILTFINSYYWEMMLHLTIILESGININQIVQMLHLAPIPFLIMKFKFNSKKEVIIILLYGLLYSSAIGFIVLQFMRYRKFAPIFPYLIQHRKTIIAMLYDSNRAISLFLLLKVFYKHGEIK